MVALAETRADSGVAAIMLRVHNTLTGRKDRLSR